MDVDKALVMNRSIQDSIKCFKELLLNHHRLATNDNEITLPSGSDRQRRSKRRKASANVDYDEDSPKKGDDPFRDDCHNDGFRNDDHQESPIERKMQSRNYARMKKIELRKLCKEYDIPTSGTEQELMDRMRKFQSMWNAEADSIEPKKPSDLAAELKKELQAQQDEKKRAVITGAAGDMKCMEKLNENIKTGNLTSGNVTFDKKMKTNFNSLVNQLRERMKKDSGTSTSAFKPLCDAKTSNGGDGDHESHFSGGSENEVVVTESFFDVINIDSSSVETHINRGETRIKPKSATFTKTASNGPSAELVFSNTTSSSVRQKPPTRDKELKPASQICGGVSDKKKMTKRTSPSPSSVHTSRVNWACDRCTFVNIGIDYVCQICSYRKT
eukprot:jgi/Psemu1/243625/estExt_Genewise1.C_3700013